MTPSSTHCGWGWTADAAGVGMADALRNELVGSGVSVFHFMPANIDSPGLKTEVRAWAGGVALYTRSCKGSA